MRIEGLPADGAPRRELERAEGSPFRSLRSSLAARWRDLRRAERRGKLSPMGRKLFTLAMVVPALLCAAACVLWVASRGRVHYVEWQGRAHELTLESGNGVVHVVFARDAGLYSAGGWRVASMVRSGRNWSIPGPNEWGFQFYAGKTRGRPQGNWGIGNRPIWIVWVPHWTIALATC